jgi:uncharacterized membrane protein YkoI
MWTFLLALLASLFGAPAGPARAEEAAVHREAAKEAAKDLAKDAPAETGAPGKAAREQNCLSPADMREVLEAKRVIDPVAAIRAAQAAVPKAQIVRANLCLTEEQHYVYLLTALRRDGHFVHVSVNAESGKVAGLW